jgi:hypothetical protein
MPKPAAPKPKSKPKTRGRSVPAKTAIQRGRTPAAARGHHSLVINPDQYVALRDLFWHNVVREMLAGLMVVAEKKPELMDGRFAILTRGGERIAIAQVTPVFGMSVRGSQETEEVSAAVQMTVFRVATPDGEMFTLPVHEIRGFHELTPELLARLQQAEAMEEAAAKGEDAVDKPPFGLAAFQALPTIPPHVPDHPME